MQTSRILLRRWQEGDAETLFKYASDPDVGPLAGWPPHKSVEESLEVIRTIFSSDTVWAVVLKETNEPIGCMGYYKYGESNIPIGENDCEVGYWLAKPYWNQGICTEALRLMVDYCINVKHFDNIWSDHFIGNPASGRVMEKCGFEDTGKVNRCSNLLGGDKEDVRIKLFNIKEKSLKLAWSVFLDFEAPEYPPEGIEEFNQSLKNPDYTNQLHCYAYSLNGEIIGMLATRKKGSHIALFFVNKNYHRQGIGRKLYNLALADCPADKMTVFSAPYAVKIYEALGFNAAGEEMVDNGIRYTPMEKTISENKY